MMMPIQIQEKSREYICSCQKSYFSYAALFTHIKQKHNGKAPGQITKPKALNKRGRPRKCPSTAKSQEQESEIKIGNDNTNLNNSNYFYTINNDNNDVFKISAGSQFKQYKQIQQNKQQCQIQDQILKQNEYVPTSSEIPQEQQNNQINLLQDLTKNLISMQSLPISQDRLKGIDAYKLLKIKNKVSSPLITCLQGFIQFVKKGVSCQISSQIQLLIILLLQHVYEENNKSISQLESLSHLHLNQYIDRFFQKLETYTSLYRFDQIIVFKQLNPMKILVVLYNWINTLDSYSVNQTQ